MQAVIHLLICRFQISMLEIPDFHARTVTHGPQPVIHNLLLGSTLFCRHGKAAALHLCFSSQSYFLLTI